MKLLKILFYDLFLYLKNDLKIELDMVQYEQFVHLLLSGVWGKSITAESPDEKNKQIKNTLRNLCITLWIPHKKHLDTFNAYYDFKYDELGFKFSEDKFDHPLTNEIVDEINIDTPLDSTPTILSPNPPVSSKGVKESIESSTLTNSSEDANTINIFVDISQDGEGGGHALVAKEEKTASALDTTFIFSDDKHLPFSNRKSLQLWRKLNSVTQRVEGDRIDVKNTVHALLKQRILLEPVKELEKKGSLNTILFIEHGGPMIAFQSWWQQLIDHIGKSNKNGSIQVFYFNNYPLPTHNQNNDDYYLFLNTSHTMSKKLSEIQKKINKDTLILFFSDAGALNTKVNDDQINYTIQFIQKLDGLCQRMLWLNPTLQSQWENTAANIIGLVINMITYNLTGLEKGIKILR